MTIKINGIEVITAKKNGDVYTNELGAVCDKTPRPLGNKLYAVMPDRDDERYADYVTAVKQIKAERIVPGRVTKAAKALNLLAKTMNPKQIKVVENQGEAIKTFINGYVENLGTAIDANVANNVQERADIQFSF